MLAYLLRRVLLIIPTVVLVGAMIFSIMALIPGDLAVTLLGPEVADPANLAKIRTELGLDRPAVVRFGEWAWNTLHGDLGYSYVRHMDVTEVIVEHVQPTIVLGISGLFVMLIISLPAGIISAVKRGSYLDASVTFVSMMGVGIPSFWLGIMLIYLFSLVLGWLPATGYVSPFEDLLGCLRHLVLPALTLGTVITAQMTRFVRSSTLEVLGQDYIVTAYAKGLKDRAVILKHAVRNAMLPIITVLGLRVAIIIGGTVVIETIFAIPGIGRLIVTAALQRDYPVVQGVVLILSISVLVTNIIVDILYSVFDPRVKYT